MNAKEERNARSTNAPIERAEGTNETEHSMATGTRYAIGRASENKNPEEDERARTEAAQREDETRGKDRRK